MKWRWSRVEQGPVRIAARDARVPREETQQEHGPTQRQLRVAEEIRHVLAGVFARREFRDPELAEADMTVTEVRISPDLKTRNRIHFRLGRSDVEALLPALKACHPLSARAGGANCGSGSRRAGVSSRIPR